VIDKDYRLTVESEAANDSSSGDQSDDIKGVFDNMGSVYDYWDLESENELALIYLNHKDKFNSMPFSHLRASFRSHLLMIL